MRELLRLIWISQLQDRYNSTTHDDMENIIGHVDRLVDSITEEEAEELL